MPANKVSKAPGRPTTASKPESSATDQQSTAVAQPLVEKEGPRQADPSQDRKATKPESTLPAVNGDFNRVSGDAPDQRVPEIQKEIESKSGPSVAVQGPPRLSIEQKVGYIAPDPTPEQKDGGGDVAMEDPTPLPTEKEEPAISSPGSSKMVLPPPPPVLQAGSSNPIDETIAPEPDQKQQWLLPPIAPRFQGKKCLVLDLDETLVHSSFKV